MKLEINWWALGATIILITFMIAIIGLIFTAPSSEMAQIIRACDWSCDGYPSERNICVIDCLETTDLEQICKDQEEQT